MLRGNTVTKQTIRFITAVIFSIVSSVLLSASISSKQDITLLSQGIWQATNTNHLLHIMNQDIIFYHINKGHCVQISNTNGVNTAKRTINDVRLYKTHNQGWLLSPTPSTWNLTFRLENRALKQDKVNYRKIESLPDACRPDSNSNSR